MTQDNCCCNETMLRSNSQLRNNATYCRRLYTNSNVNDHTGWHHWHAPLHILYFKGYTETDNTKTHM